MKGATALVPLCAESKWILDDILEAARTAFGEEITITAVNGGAGFRTDGRQPAASDIIKGLLPLRMDFSRVLGITNSDLFHPGVNHVFGFADPGSRVSVISLYRFRTGGVSAGKIACRAVKTAIHELGHTYGLRHCTDHRCVMFFSFNLADTDYKSREFCGKCKDEISSRLKNPLQRKEVC